MRDSGDFLELIKRVAINAIESKKPVVVRYGTVQTVNPLTILLEQKITLTKEFLVLTKSVVSHNIDVEIDGQVQKITLENGLEIGNKVALLRVQGGQKYIVIDKVVN